MLVHALAHRRLLAIDDGRLFWIRLLESLSRQLPDYTWLEAVNQEDLPPEEIRIAGATSPTSFYRAINGLLARPRDLVAELRTASKDSTVISRLAA